MKLLDQRKQGHFIISVEMIILASCSSQPHQVVVVYINVLRFHHSGILVLMPDTITSAVFLFPNLGDTIGVFYVCEFFSLVLGYYYSLS